MDLLDINSGGEIRELNSESVRCENPENSSLSLVLRKEKTSKKLMRCFNIVTNITDVSGGEHREGSRNNKEH
jgi:hypothetical protein